MITTALILGLLLWLFQSFASGVQVFNDDTDGFAKGLGCAFVPFALGVAVFTLIAIFRLY